ncbi:hypothetical protein L218DRAFT_1005555 [Marasmius fiardii PR-910]|nr:hypothetical protein L218DRAFT_1005555 [Marasmius fiardii PR-910]
MKAGTAVNSAETSASGSPLHRTRTRQSYSDNTGARRPQTSTGVPQTAPPKSSSSSTTTSNRPSTATRYSSPKRYSSPRSARSSTSSYGKEIPPLPTFSNLKLETPRYILSPAELAASQQHVNSPVMSNTEKALPLPPSQRHRKTSHTQNSNFVSPMISEFSTASPINVFPKKSHTGRPATSPSAPPLPTCSSNHPTTTAFLPSSPVSYTPPFPINSRYVKNDDGRDMSAMKDDTLPPNRKSTSSIKKPVNTSSPWEATVGRTSDEEVWEGLLRKSAQAGGTLHIRSTDTEQLESDNLRFSVADI